LASEKIVYYSAFTEDLFYWDNGLGLDAEPKLKIQPNSFARVGTGRARPGPKHHDYFFSATPAKS
jgi:hypothetical protein